jgi:hypothetical protein
MSVGVEPHLVGLQPYQGRVLPRYRFAVAHILFLELRVVAEFLVEVEPPIPFLGAPAQEPLEHYRARRWLGRIGDKAFGKIVWG